MARNRKNYGHNRYLDFSSKIGEMEYEKAKHTPTDKQRRFYRDLVMRCKDNNIDPTPEIPIITRSDYFEGISRLICLLKSQGIEVKTRAKNAILSTELKEDKMGFLMTRERIREGGEEDGI